MHSAHSIELLPATTRTKLRSTQILTSLPQIVSELLQNSLDAGAGQVDIGVDCVEWICWVKDDGEGITREGMSTIGKGSEEGRYGKCYSVIYWCDWTSSLFQVHPRRTTRLPWIKSLHSDFAEKVGLYEWPQRMHRWNSRTLSSSICSRYILSRNIITHSAIQRELVYYCQGRHPINCILLSKLIHSC